MRKTDSGSAGELSSALFAAAFDALGIGIAVLDETGKAVFFNQAMGRISVERDGLAISQQGLTFSDAAEDQKFRELFQTARSTRRKKEAKFLIPRPSGKRPYNAFLKVMGAEAYNGGSDILGVVCIKDSNQSSNAAAPLLRDTWGLSPAEAELALALVDTGSLQAAAARRGITEGSARQYVKRIFHKTLTKGQVDLVALIVSAVGF